MSVQVRFFLIILVIGLSVALIWPNIGERTIRLYANETFSETKRDEVLSRAEAYIKDHYKGRYTPKIAMGKPIGNPKGVDEKYLSITGKFVQAAFLNELSRIEGVDAARMALEPMWVERNLKAKPFKLGLDLQGGMNLVLEGDFEKVAARMKELYPPEMVQDLEKKKEAEKNAEEKKSIQAKLDSIKQATDLSPEKRKSDMEGVLQILSSRINQTGTSEPLIRLQGNEQIEISLPGVANPDQAKQLIASTARVTYHLHDPQGEEQRYTQLANLDFAEYTKLGTDVQREKFLKNLAEKIKMPKAFSLMVMYGKNPNITHKGQHLEPESFLVVDKEPVMTGEAMSRNVYEDRNPEDGRIVVSFELTSAGADKFGKITSENQGKLLAIAIDDKIRSAPRIQGPILGGRGQITGDFDVQEARALAIVIREGALPVPLNIVEERSVGPTLGQAAIDAGLKAIFVGFILVFAYMLLYYHGSGFIASVGLLINLLLMAAIFALMDFTITLPGLAGVVLTMGMAVDSNVIIYERIREELARGKSVKLAVAAGFERASLTIIDANLTTLIAAIILASKLGVGPIKGFGVTLFIGIVTTLFTALVVTRAIMEYLAYSVEIKSLSIGFGKHRKATKLVGGKA
ncbi:MAG: Protein translocase subunit SecD [Turneriella sp.]|nr:Protein translocase subunit SecD [Turneriella sp.]